MSPVLQNVWLRARQTFLPFRGVVGVGYGPKVKGDEVVSRHAIIVLVAKKLPAREVPADQLIPSVFHGHPTDVREPRLTLHDDEIGEAGGMPEDFCLTDHQWIDAMKVHRMRLEQQGGRASDLI